MHDNNAAAGLAARRSMQLFTAPRALPLFGTPTILTWGVNSNSLLALALCALHESDAQLVPSRLSWPFSATECVPQDPPRQFLAAPAENPANVICNIHTPGACAVHLAGCATLIPFHFPCRSPMAPTVLVR